MCALNVYTKLGKALIASEGNKKAAVFTKGGAQMIQAIEAECEKDKSMSNLKGKIKEIKQLMQQM